MTNWPQFFLRLSVIDIEFRHNIVILVCYLQLQDNVMLQQLAKNRSKLSEKQKNTVKTLGCSNLRISICLALRAYVSWKQNRKRLNLEFTTIFFVHVNRKIALHLASASSNPSPHPNIETKVHKTKPLSRALHSQKWLTTHYSIICQILKMAIWREFSCIWTACLW